MSLQLANSYTDSDKQHLLRLDSIEKTYRAESKYLIKRAIDADYGKEYDKLSQELIALDANPESEAYKEKQAALKSWYKEAAKDSETNDRDYMFISFILKYLPKGLIGLLLAVILSAAMSSTASEINALATITSIDLYKRNREGVTHVSTAKDDTHYVKMTKIFTLGWGILAIIIACFASLAENLIQLVNIIGSIFYGNVLGIFLLAFFFKSVKGNAVFVAALITQVAVIFVWWIELMPYLWLNLFGCLLVMILALIIQSTQKKVV